MAFKPKYKKLPELCTDSLDTIYIYLSSIDVEEYRVCDLVKLSSVLADIYKMTYAASRKIPVDRLAKEINGTAFFILSECLNTLEDLKDRQEITSKGDYINTMKVLVKVKKVAEDCISMSNNGFDEHLVDELTQEELKHMGLEI